MKQFLSHNYDAANFIWQVCAAMEPSQYCAQQPASVGDAEVRMWVEGLMLGGIVRADALITEFRRTTDVLFQEYLLHEEDCQKEHYQRKCDVFVA